MSEEKIHFFKRNVGHSISIRFYKGDKLGTVLNAHSEFAEVEASKLKAFKEVNKYAILNGLIVEVDEPVSTWETDNALTDDDINALLSNWLKFKNKIPTIDSVPILYKLLEAAQEKGSSRKVIDLIEERINVVEPAASGPIDRDEAAYSYDEGLVAAPRL